MLASGSDDGTVRLWDMDNGALLHILAEHAGGIWSVAWSGDGRMLASGSDDGTVRLWEVASGISLHILRGHRGGIWSVAWSEDGRLASGSEDGTVRLWDAVSETSLYILEGHANWVWSVAWSGDGRVLASGGGDGTVRLWDTTSGALLRVLEDHTDWIWNVMWSRDGRSLAGGSKDGTVRLWDLASGALLRILEGHIGEVWSVAWSKDGRLASGSDDGTVRLWDATSGTLLHILKGHTEWSWSVAWSGDGRNLVGGADDGTVRQWDTASGVLLRIRKGHMDRVWSVAWSEDGQLLASGGGDGTVRLWDAAKGALLHTRRGYTNWICSVALSKQGRLLASGGSDGTVRLWDAASGALLRAMEGHTAGVRSVAWSSDGQTLASGGEDGTVRIWLVANGALLRILEGHTAGVRSVAWSSDGQTLASGGEDGTARLWDAKAGTALKDFRSDFPAHVVVSVSFQPISPSTNILGKIRLGGSDLIVQFFTLAQDQQSSVEVNMTRYISAKIVLVGESNVGKSCLALRLVEGRYEEQGTTHGMRLWSIPLERLGAVATAPPGEQRELVLWDLGGQDEYRLVHQLFLHDTTLALMLIDPTRGQKAFDDVVEWNLRLEKQLRGRKIAKLLIGTKLDREGQTELIDPLELDYLLSCCGAISFYPTSAKVPRGIDELCIAIAQAINWSELSQITRPLLFQYIRDIVIQQQNQERVILLYNDLEQQIHTILLEKIEPSAIWAVVRQLAMQGVIANTRLASGQQALVLRVDYIERYAGSLILAARNNSRRIPAIEVAATIGMKSMPGISEMERLHPFQERIVLECVVELLMEHGICLKHEGLLIFPSLFPEVAVEEQMNIAQTVSLYYDFSGAIDNIYSSLVVRLALSERFGRVRLWKNQADYEQLDGRVCGLRKVDRGSGLAHLDLLFSEQIMRDTRDLFTIFVESHLLKEGVIIREVLGIRCCCGYRFDEALVRERISDGHTDMLCPKCEKRLPISEGAKKVREGNSAMVAELFALKTVIEENKRIEVNETKRVFANEKSDEKNQIRILHLSDLHFNKNDDPIVQLHPLVSDLKNKEDGLGFEHLDYLVISGDLTNCASNEEFDKAYQFISKLIEKFKISAARCVIVPGNHDLNWDQQVYDWKPERKVKQDQLKLGSYVKQGDGYLIRDDDQYPIRFENFNKFYHQLIQQPYPLKAELQLIPLLFEETRIQFMAINSTWEIDEYYQERSSINLSALNAGLQRAEQQIEQAKKNKHLTGDSKILRIAIWHHPVTGNEKIKDDAFLDQLRKAEVKLCLHGHVHEDRADVVGYLHPTRKIHIAGTGSFGAPVNDRPESTPRLYNVIEIWRDHSRIRVHTRCLRKDGGAWEGWAVWPNLEDRNSRRTYYDIELSSHTIY